MQIDNHGFMGGHVYWRPQEYTHSKGFRKQDVREVSEATKMDYRI